MTALSANNWLATNGYWRALGFWFPVLTQPRPRSGGGFRYSPGEADRMDEIIQTIGLPLWVSP